MEPVKPEYWPQRRSHRLASLDYRSGAYFVTLVTAGREPVLGRVRWGRLELTPAGRIVAAEWRASGQVRADVKVDAFVVMLDHLHGILWLGRGTPQSGRESSLGSIVQHFKGRTTRLLRLEGIGAGRSVWQRDYYERAIRDRRALRAIRHYIADNPGQWLARHAGGGCM